MKTALVVLWLCLTGIDQMVAQPSHGNSRLQTDVRVTPVPYDSGTKLRRYARSFQLPTGEVFVENRLKVSVASTGDLVAVPDSLTSIPAGIFREGADNSFLITKTLVMAVGYRIVMDSLINYSTGTWRSSGDLKAISRIASRVILPVAGRVNYGTNGEWAGLFCHRGILQLRDGTLLAAVYGNFESDSVVPANPQSKLETKFMLRAFVIRSTDQGNSWEYLSSLAVPKPGQRDDSEGYNEWSMAELADGRIMAIIRTGHFSPPVICFSKDGGSGWTEPVVNPELGPAACDPWILRLSDGRIAISYGEMKQPAGDRKVFFDNFKAGDHARKCRLAISDSPEADHWQTFDITDFGNRSAYSTIYEMAPGILLYQTGNELFRINLIR